MRKIINSTYISLDGVVEGPHIWPSTGPGDPRADGIQAELALSCDVLLMGRRTYEVFAPAWTSRSGDAVSDQLNSMRKYVVSSTLRDPEWHNTTVIAGDPVPAISKLKQEPGKDILQYGFGPLTHALVREGMLDEVRLWIHPLIVGSGEPADLLFRESRQTIFTLTNSTPLSNGIVILSYELAPAQP